MTQRVNFFDAEDGSYRISDPYTMSASPERIEACKQYAFFRIIFQIDIPNDQVISGSIVNANM
jgi:hypothetical protein